MEFALRESATKFLLMKRVDGVWKDCAEFYEEEDAKTVVEILAQKNEPSSYSETIAGDPHD